MQASDASRMSQNDASIESRLRVPKSAAIAGILFCVLLVASQLLVWISIPANLGGPALEVINHSKTISFALNLLPFAGIAFLWFIAVVRNRLGTCSSSSSLSEQMKRHRWWKRDDRNSALSSFREPCEMSPHKNENATYAVQALWSVNKPPPINASLMLVMNQPSAVETGTPACSWANMWAGSTARRNVHQVFCGASNKADQENCVGRPKRRVGLTARSPSEADPRSNVVADAHEENRSHSPWDIARLKCSNPSSTSFWEWGKRHAAQWPHLLLLRHRLGNNTDALHAVKWKKACGILLNDIAYRTRLQRFIYDVRGTVLAYEQDLRLRSTPEDLSCRLDSIQLGKANVQQDQVWL